MITPNDDGGPIASTLHGPEMTVVPSGGLSLRDYFAGQSLPGLLSQRQEPGDYDGPNRTTDPDDAGIVYKGEFISLHGDDSDSLAKDAYRIADAMLAARERGAA